MNDPRRIYTGADYAPTVALVVFALVFSPALLVLSGPVGEAPLTAALAFSAACLALAWILWTRFSTLSIASVVLGASNGSQRRR